MRSDNFIEFIFSHTMLCRIRKLLTYQVGLYFLSNSFLMKAATSFAFQKIKTCEHFRVNPAAKAKIYLPFDLFLTVTAAKMQPMALQKEFK